jgi:iron complex outermembrane receptor protein
MAVSVMAISTSLMVIPAYAQQNPQPLPELKVERKAASSKKQKLKSEATGNSLTPPAQAATSASTPSLTSPSFAQASNEAARIPGSVAVIADKDFKDRQSTTIKDVLDYVPGVFVQPKWGEDSRLSIRGSGLSRNFHLRGVQLYMDGIPINTADGYGDFQEIDPSAYRFVQVYKGGNGLQLGANSLGGAINFVTPTGRDSAKAQASISGGSWGYHREQISSGMAFGPADYFVTLSNQRQGGYRDHSDGTSVRGSANLGYQLSEYAETRFYLNANTIEQKLPGEVSRTAALTNPKAAEASRISQNWQRNIDSLRIANKTTLKFDPTTVEFGAFYTNRHLMHPIAVWLEDKHDDYGLFVRAIDERDIAGHHNKLTTGITVFNGTTDARLFDNPGNAVKGTLNKHTRQEANNTAIYAENAYSIIPDLALVTGFQYLDATRKEIGLGGAWFPPALVSGHYDSWSPKIGLVYDLKPHWQLFGNISRSSEVPSFGEGTAVTNFASVRPQTATTVELGTRGKDVHYKWDVAVYRAAIADELQCLAVAMGMCSVSNVNSTIHQGVEAGFGFALLRSVFLNTQGYQDQIWINTAYTYSDFRFDHDTTFSNNQIPGVPKHYMRGEALYKHPSGFFGGPNVEWAPQSYFVDNANTFKSPGYALLGFRLGYDKGENFTAFVDGKNLLNKKYISSTSVVNQYDPTFNQFNPGNGRGIFGGISMKY